MLDWIAQNSWAFWLIVVLVFIGIEMLSLDLWFATIGVGSIAGVVAGLLNASFWLELILVAVLTLILLIFLRPIAIKHLQQPSAMRTNIDALVGVQALVIETVSAQSGTAKIGGETWTARTPAGVSIPSGAAAWVVQIDGATALLSPTPLAQPQPQK